jgi:hypothetical protein
MVLRAWRRRHHILFAALLLGGCASAQLNFNTVDVTSSFADLMTRQVLANLSRYIDDPEALPAQADIAAGTVQTSNSVTPAITGPLTQSIAFGATGAITSSAVTGASTTGTFSDAWQQNWNLAPITDANTLRNLRAIYRYAVYKTLLEAEYHVPRVAVSGGLQPDTYMLALPQCVLCGSKHVRNPRLHGGWLYWTGRGSSGIENPPPQDLPVVFLGHYSGHNLYMLRSDFDLGYLSDFTLFVLPVSEPAVNGGGGGGGGGGAASAPSRHNFNILVPQQIQR